MARSRITFFDRVAPKITEADPQTGKKEIKYVQAKQKPFKLSGWAGYQDAQMFRNWRDRDDSENFIPQKIKQKKLNDDFWEKHDQQINMKRGIINGN